MLVGALQQQLAINQVVWLLCFAFASGNHQFWLIVSHGRGPIQTTTVLAADMTALFFFCSFMTCSNCHCKKRRLHGALSIAELHIATNFVHRRLGSGTPGMHHKAPKAKLANSRGIL
jgi:apolipoprotein N-acyltransferase